jgi:hypothetical protein
MNEIVLFVGKGMELQIIMLGNISQIEKRKILYVLSYMWNADANNNEGCFGWGSIRSGRAKKKDDCGV